MICACGKEIRTSNVPTMVKCKCGRFNKNFNTEPVTKAERNFDFYKVLMKHKPLDDRKATNKYYRAS